MENAGEIMKRLSKQMDGDPFVKQFGLNPMDYITLEEIDMLVYSLHRSNPDFTQQEAMNVARWVIKIRVGESLIGLVKKGLADVASGPNCDVCHGEEGVLFKFRKEFNHGSKDN